MILERATDMPVSRYLQEKVWKPLGMEADGSWSLDSTGDGFEKMESGVNARARDFARFGMLFAREGNWEGGQLISRSEEHTSELQSRQYLVCRLLLEKKKMNEPKSPIAMI